MHWRYCQWLRLLLLLREKVISLVKGGLLSDVGGWLGGGGKCCLPESNRGVATFLFAIPEAHAASYKRISRPCKICGYEALLIESPV